MIPIATTADTCATMLWTPHARAQSAALAAGPSCSARRPGTPAHTGRVQCQLHRPGPHHCYAGVRGGADQLPVRTSPQVASAERSRARSLGEAGSRGPHGAADSPGSCSARKLRLAGGQILVQRKAETVDTAAEHTRAHTCTLWRRRSCPAGHTRHAQWRRYF